jgi:predicted O-methyltransferase YrrM
MPHFEPDFFTPLAKSNFEKILPKIIDFNNDINYLEIGSFHGASTYFMFNNLLNKNSKATIIDPFDDSKSEAIGDFEKFKNNMTDYLDRIDIKKDITVNILEKLNKEYYDIAYIDGSHKAVDVYYDLINTFDLVKKGGIIVCDDYLWWLLDMPPFHESQPMKAINKFIKEKFNEIEFITKPVLLDLNQDDSSIVLNEYQKKQIFGMDIRNFSDLTRLSENDINEINYQFIFKKK